MPHLPFPSENHQPRIAFAHTLRGVACLLVVIAHLVLMFGCASAAVPALTGIDYPTPASGFLSSLAAHQPVALGPFGVAIFFLVSGLVIPLSIQNNSRLAFAVSRFFRLVPTYVCALLITMTGLWAIQAAFGQHYSFPWRSALAHVCLVRDLAWFAPIDGVVWTLEIEGRFYLACMLLAPLLRAADYRGMLLTCLVLTAASVWTGPIPEGVLVASLRWYAFLSAMSMTALFVNFMWIGTIFCFHRQKRCSTKEAVVAIVLLNAMFIAQLYFGAAVAAPIKSVYLIAYQSALGVFTLGYCLPDRFVQARWLDKLADISYPLYAVHGALGYALETLIYRWVGNIYISISITCALMLVLATIVHRLVERPSQQWGKRLAKLANWSNAQSPPASAAAATATGSVPLRQAA